MSLLDDLKGLEGLQVRNEETWKVACPNCDKFPGMWQLCKESDCADATLRYIAASLTKLGYVKVARCGECEDWGGNRDHIKECAVCAGWLEEKGEGLCYGHFIENMGGVMMKATDFCPYGIRLVAKSATTETIVPAPEKAE